MCRSEALRKQVFTAESDGNLKLLLREVRREVVDVALSSAPVGFGNDEKYFLVRRGLHRRNCTIFFHVIVFTLWFLAAEKRRFYS